MITIPNQIEFIPVLNILPQPMLPAIYIPSIIHPFIPYNFVNYQQCDNFSHYNAPYDQNFTQPNPLPPGLQSPDDEVFYFHDFFFSKDDPGLGYYDETLVTPENYENIIAIKQKSVELSSLTFNLMKSIWNKQLHSDTWGEVSMYKGQNIHHNEWKSFLIELFQDQANLNTSKQMAKVICKLLESSTENSRFQKYCRNNSVHKISQEDYEEFDLLNEIKNIFNNEDSEPFPVTCSQSFETEAKAPLAAQAKGVSVAELNEKKVYKVAEDLDSKKASHEIKRKVQDLIITLTNYHTIIEGKVDICGKLTGDTLDNGEENLPSPIEQPHKEVYIAKKSEVKYNTDAKENNKNNVNVNRRVRKGLRKAKEVKNYSNEVESIPSDSEQAKQTEKRGAEDQGRIKIQKEFQEDQDMITSLEGAHNKNNQQEKVEAVTEEKLEKNVKSKKSKKYRKRKTNKKAAQGDRQIESNSDELKGNNMDFALDIPNNNLSAHIEKLLQMTLNQEKEDKFEPWSKDDLLKTSTLPKSQEENGFTMMKDFVNDLSKDDILKNHNFTLTGETSAKTETDISTEYEECKQEGSLQKTQNSSKKSSQYNQPSKIDFEDQITQITRQTDYIHSPQSGSNAENEYYLDMISNILSEDPSALERLKEMLLSHSVDLGLTGGFTAEELQEIEEVNMELEKVMKRRFVVTANDEEDENHLPCQEEKPSQNRSANQEHDLVGLSNELVSLSALLCDDFEDLTLQKSHEIESNAFGIPVGTMSYLEELMRSRAEFMEVLQSGTKNICREKNERKIVI